MTSPLTARLRTHWATLAPREQALVLAATTVVGLAVLWWLLLAPALHTLREAPARHAALDAQLQRMHALQAEALQLKDAPRAQGGEALRTLRGTLTQQLGAAAQLSVAGDRATITLKGVPAEALAHWLAQARAGARAVPLEARLVRTAGAPDTPARWDGTLVLALPAE
ncbi:type II secretion system protein GspM [Acidovorax sp. SDU_ACID1]|uniref:type II secretion system protein GspM n=1 Tax=Acidovorax sp. SDU_ACID1 TaxID=3136632 RepID=UPI003872CFBF